MQIFFWYILLGNIGLPKEKKNEWKEKWKNETTSKELVMGVYLSLFKSDPQISSVLKRWCSPGDPQKTKQNTKTSMIGKVVV